MPYRLQANRKYGYHSTAILPRCLPLWQAPMEKVLTNVSFENNNEVKKCRVGVTVVHDLVDPSVKGKL